MIDTGTAFTLLIVFLMIRNGVAHSINMRRLAQIDRYRLAATTLDDLAQCRFALANLRNHYILMFDLTKWTYASCYGARS